MKKKERFHCRMSLSLFARANPIRVPDTAAEPYLRVARLLRLWRWAAHVGDALVAGRRVPRRVVAEYLAKSRGALPPSRRRDYPDLAVMYPDCYMLRANGRRVRV